MPRRFGVGGYSFDILRARKLAPGALHFEPDEHRELRLEGCCSSTSPVETVKFVPSTVHATSYHFPICIRRPADLSIFQGASDPGSITLSRQRGFQENSQGHVRAATLPIGQAMPPALSRVLNAAAASRNCQLLCEYWIFTRQAPVPRPGPLTPGGKS